MGPIIIFRGITISAIVASTSLLGCSHLLKESDFKNETKLKPLKHEIFLDELVKPINQTSDANTHLLTIQQVHPEEQTKQQAWQNLEKQGLGDLFRNELSPEKDNACDQAFERWDDHQKLAMRDEEESIKLADVFVDTCLTPVNQFGNLLNFVAFLYANDTNWKYAHPCLATRIAAARFLTARHCVFREYNAEDGIQEWHPLRKEQIKLFLAIQPNTPIEISHIIHPQAIGDRTDTFNSYLDDALDFVVLETKESLPALPTHTIKSRHGALGERARLIGFYPMLLRNREMQLLPKNWLMAVRMDERPLCHINTIAPETGCIYHGCQTQSGSSGAPMFDLDGKTIISLHTRQFGVLKAAGRCYDKSFADMPNGGILVPNKLE